MTHEELDRNQDRIIYETRFPSSNDIHSKQNKLLLRNCIIIYNKIVFILKYCIYKY